MDRHQLLMERDQWKLAENAALKCGDLRAGYEALKEVEAIDKKLAALKEGAPSKAA